MAFIGAGLTAFGVHTISGLFKSSAQLRAQKEALRVINEARQEGITQSKALTEQFKPFFTESRGALDEARTFDVTSASFDPLLKRLLGVAEQGATEGLTEADRIAFEDARKLMNENLVATGNLRSGAAAFFNTELTRRVLADSVTRRQNYLQLALGGQQQGSAQRLNLLQSVLNRGQIAGSIGLGGQQLATNLLTASMGLAPAAASAAAGVGAARGGAFDAISGGASAGLSTFSLLNSAAADKAYADSLRKK